MSVSAKGGGSFVWRRICLIRMLPVSGRFGNGSLRLSARACREKDPEINAEERPMRKREAQGAGAEHKNRSLCTELII